MGLRKEQRLVVLRDVEVFCTVQMAATGSVSQVVTLPAGEVLVVDREVDSAVFVRPHRYAALEADFVEPALRQSTGYRGYCLEVSRDDFTEHCKVLDQPR
jgi:hypothetical protein